MQIQAHLQVEREGVERVPTIFSLKKEARPSAESLKRVEGVAVIPYQESMGLLAAQRA